MTFCYRKRIYHPSGVSLIAKGDGESARLAFGASLTLICFVATFCAPATAQEADIEINTEKLGGIALGELYPGGGTFLLTSTGAIIESGSLAGIATEETENPANGWTLNINGNVTAKNWGIVLYGPDTLTIGPGASVGGGTGVSVSSDHDASIENSGMISGVSWSILHNGQGHVTFINNKGAIADGGIGSIFGRMSVDNAGTIDGKADYFAVSLDDESELINREGGRIVSLFYTVSIEGRGTIENAGEIKSNPPTAHDPSDPFPTVFLYSGSVKNSATGLIEGHFGVRFGTGEDMEGSSTLENSGTIVATARNAAAFILVEEASLNNTATGKLLGTTEGIQIYNVPKTNIVNAGLISGFNGIALIGDGERTIVNSGSIVANGGRTIYKTGGRFNLVLQTGSVIEGDIIADSVDSLRLEGEGREDDALLGFGSVVMAGSAWALEGEVEGDKLAVELGALTLKGNAAFNETSVAEGSALVVDGVLSGPVDVLGQLGGYGEVGSVKIAPGGVHALGDAIGTQIVNGDYINYGTLVIKATPDGADSVVVTGGVDITGATLSLLLTPEDAAGWKIVNGPFTLIAKESAGSVTGAFDRVDSNLLFLDIAVDYAGGDGNDVTLELTRNDIEFGSIGVTRNQRAVGRAIDALSDDHPVWNAIALSSDEEMARQSFDRLSGEIHASAKTVLIEDAAHARNFANDRIRASFAAIGASIEPVLAYGAKGSALDFPSPSHGLTAWSRVFGSWGASDSDGNASSLDYGSGGLFIGGDAMLADWRVGVIAGHSRTRFETDALNASGSAQNYHLGLYGGTQWANVGVRTGLVHTWHDVETNRAVLIGGSMDDLRADYRAGTLQAFGELGFGINTSISDLEGFVNVAHTSLRVERFTEDGGAAALSAISSNTNTTFTTLGLRTAIDLATGDFAATLRGMIGWRHAFGDITPLSIHAFDVGNTFTVAGLPIAEDATVLQAGFDFNLNKATTFVVDYNGQFAAGHREQAFNAQLRFEF